MKYFILILILAFSLFSLTNSIIIIVKNIKEKRGKSTINERNTCTSSKEKK